MKTAFIVIMAVSFMVPIIVLLRGRGSGNSLRKRFDILSGNADEPEKQTKKEPGQSIFGKLDASIRGLSLSNYIKTELNKANWALKVSEFIVFVILSASLVPLIVLLLTNNQPVSVGLMILGGLFPVIYLKRRQAARRKQFGGQLPDAITLISNSLKSGYSFLQSIDLVAREMAPPISDEFTKVLREIKLGIPFDRAVDGMVKRVNDEDLELIMTSVKIQREVGGNLSEILDKISHTIRERIRIKGQLQTLTAQGRLSGLILSVLPLGLGLFLYMTQPDYVGLLFKHPLGRVMLGAALISHSTGMYLIKRITNVKV